MLAMPGEMALSPTVWRRRRRVCSCRSSKLVLSRSY
jgi:hypothetical protein